MKKEIIMRYTMPVVAIVASVGLGFAGVTAAQTSTTPGPGGIQKIRGMMGQRPGIMGKVSSISGTMLTVIATNPKDSVTTTYTVDVSGAKFMKASSNATPVVATLADIVVGDAVAVRGTVSGTHVTATDVLDGIAQMGMRRGGMMGGRGSHAPIGQDGTITAISGTSVSMQEEADEGGATYTVDASAAAITVNGAASTVAGLKVGDKIMVGGTVSGTTVTAKTISDGHGAHIFGVRKNAKGTN